MDHRRVQEIMQHVQHDGQHMQDIMRTLHHDATGKACITCRNLTAHTHHNGNAGKVGDHRSITRGVGVEVLTHCTCNVPPGISTVSCLFGAPASRDDQSLRPLGHSVSM